MGLRTTIAENCYACGERLSKKVMRSGATFYNTYNSRTNHKDDCRNNFKDKFQRDWTKKGVKPVKIKTNSIFGEESMDISFTGFMNNPEGSELWNLDGLINYYPPEQLKILKDIQQNIIDKAKRKAQTAEMRKYNFSLPEEIIINKEDEYTEGAVKNIAINSYERDWKARKACIEHYGAKCIICNFDFHKRFGDTGKGFIHVHHLKKLSEIGKTYKVDPIKDLKPVCPNCHAMLHRRKEPYTIEELKIILKNNKTDNMSRQTAMK